MHRAYSILHVKEMQEDERRVFGMATTPDVDRMGDVVDPMGAKFKNPSPLLLYHDHSMPVGEVKFGKPTKDGIPFEAQIKSTDAPGRVKERLDEAWESVKLGLIKAVSIGFRVLEDGYEFIKETGGFRFTAIEIMELSLVPIPANQSATITSIKSIDHEHLRAVSGGNGGRPASRLKTSPGVPGQRPKDTKMKTYAQRIAEAEATLAASQTRQEELMAAADEAGTTLGGDELKEYDELDAQCKDLSGHIARLKALAERSKAAAKPAEEKTDDNTATTVPARQITVKSNTAPGQRFARSVLAIVRAGGNMHEAIQIAKANKAWADTPDVAEYLRIKTAIPAGDTTTSGWASELVYNTNLVSEFLEYLRPSTILGRIQGWRNVPFNVRVGGASSGLTGGWVGEGDPIAVSKMTTTSTTLGITKAAGIAALTKELIRSSSPSAELMVRDELRRAVQYILDRSLIDPTQGGVSNQQPAAITYNITPVSATGTTYASLNTDFQSLATAMDGDNIDTSSGVWVMSRTTARALSGMVTSLGVSQFPSMTPEGGSLFGYPVIVSQSAYFSSGSPNYGHMMVFIVPSEVFLADDGMVDIEMSNQAAIQLLDNPTNSSVGGTTATAMVSMFQTDSVAVKAVRYINWARARSNAVGFIRNAAYA